MSRMEKVPLVSIGMPLFNAERFLTRALDSILKQEFQQFELIISDNHSTDRTSKICEAYAAGDQRIRYTSNDTNLGAITNFNKVLESAQGNYFMWAAYDDLWEPKFIATLVDLLETTPNAILAFCSCDRIDTDGSFIYSHRQYGRLQNSNNLVRSHRYIWFPDGEGRAMVIYGLMLSAVLKKTGGIKTYSLYEAADDMLILRLALLGNFVFRDEILFHKRDVPESATFTKWRFSDWFMYYHDYRRIIIESELSRLEKIILLFSITLRQVVFQLGKPPYHLFLAVRKYLTLKTRS